MTPTHLTSSPWMARLVSTWVWSYATRSRLIRLRYSCTNRCKVSTPTNYQAYQSSATPMTPVHHSSQSTWLTPTWETGKQPPRLINWARAVGWDADTQSSVAAITASWQEKRQIARLGKTVPCTPSRMAFALTFLVIHQKRPALDQERVQ